MYGIIEDLCTRNGIKPGRLCSELSISRGTLGDLKAGRTKSLSMEVVTKIAGYFSVSTDYLLGNEEKEKPLVNGDEELTEYLEVLKTRPEMRMLFQLSKDATKEDVEAAVRIIEALRNK
jgi:transcriptional regulator with XRE-family HTH domain